MLRINHFEVVRIAQLFDKFEEVVCYTDGSSLENPGVGGAAAVFMGLNRQAQTTEVSRATQEKEIQQRVEEEFLFGVTLHLGLTSNNYAEYVGLLLGQLFAALFRQPTICLHSDSQLVVQQVKGAYKTKNVRLVDMVKICHHFALKFE
jgi:ribonuclease HI